MYEEMRYYHVVIQHSDSGVSIGTAFLTDHEVAIFDSITDKLEWGYEKGEPGCFYIDHDCFDTKEDAEQSAKQRFANLY